MSIRLNSVQRPAAGGGVQQTAGATHVVEQRVAGATHVVEQRVAGATHVVEQRVDVTLVVGLCRRVGENRVDALLDLRVQEVVELVLEHQLLPTNEQLEPTNTIKGGASKK